MPNAVKYATTPPSGSIRKTSVGIGINGIVGPTGTTGWYNGITPQGGNYIIFQTDNGFSPRIYAPQNSDELKRIALQAGATSGDVISETTILSWFNTQNGYSIINKSYPNIVTDSLIYLVDSTYVSSYPTTGTSWYNLGTSGVLSVLNNGPSFNSNDRSIVFDGVDDYVNSGYDLSWNNTNSISISFWMNPSTISGGNYGIMGKEWPDWEWAFYQNNTSLNLVYWNTGGGHTNGMDFGVGAFGTANVWYHVVYTWNGSTSIFYINGVVAGSKTAVDPSINQNRTNNVMIGGHTYVWADSYWNGKISNVNFYNKTLTQAEVLQNYYLGNIVTDNLSHAWDAGNQKSYPGTGTTTYNMTSNINGTLQNGVSYSQGNGGYWSFDGADDRILLDNYNYSFSLGDGNSNWTVNAWVKTTTSANGLGAGPILSNSNGGPVYSEMGINGGKIVYWVYPSNINGWKGWTGNITVNDGKWHMLTWVNRTGYNMDMYVDGVLDVTVSPTIAGNNNPIDIIGGCWASNFQGDIAMVQVYQGKAFNLTEVNQNFSAHSSRFR